MKMRNGTHGFTLMELLVVLGIIVILLAVILANMSSSRGKARDATRFHDLSEIRSALALYFSEHGDYPAVDGKIGEGVENSAIDTALASYFKEIPHDPQGPGDDTHYYYYERSHECGGVNNVIIFARTMENAVNANVYDCDTPDGGELAADTSSVFLIARTPN